MFLKFLEKIGRKKVVLDRGPSHPKFEEAKPWMNRYYVLMRHRPKWFPFNILIHEMLADDHGEGVHNHTFPYITITATGSVEDAKTIEGYCSNTNVTNTCINITFSWFKLNKRTNINEIRCHKYIV